MSKNLTLGSLAFAHWLGNLSKANVPRKTTAAALEVTEKTINNWAKGRTAPKPTDATRIERESRGAVLASMWRESLAASKATPGDQP